jgi:hypothetical protein
MQKNALTTCCFTCAAGAIGAFCRWLQNQLAFDESGLSVQSVWNYAVPLIIIAAAICFYSFVAKYKRSGLVMTTDFYDTFSGSNRIFIPTVWFVGAIMIFGAMILFATVPDGVGSILYRILAGFGILSGISFGVTAVGARRRYEPGLVCVFATVPVIQFCLWLITSYKQNSTNPTVWVYAVEILAIAAALLAFYYFAGYPYGRAKPYSSLYFAMLGAFLCIVALADDRNFGLQLMLASAICMQLLWIWMIVSRMHKPEEPEPEAEPSSDSVPVTDVNVSSILEEFHNGEEK